jgi:hypothetical protein
MCNHLQIEHLYYQNAHLLLHIINLEWYFSVFKCNYACRGRTDPQIVLNIDIQSKQEPFTRCTDPQISVILQTRAIYPLHRPSNCVNLRKSVHK